MDWTKTLEPYGCTSIEYDWKCFRAKNNLEAQFERGEGPKCFYVIQDVNEGGTYWRTFKPPSKDPCNASWLYEPRTLCAFANLAEKEENSVERVRMFRMEYDLLIVEHCVAKLTRIGPVQE